MALSDLHDECETQPMAETFALSDMAVTGQSSTAGTVRPSTLRFRVRCINISLLGLAIVATGAGMHPHRLAEAPDDSCRSWAVYGLGTHTQLNGLAGMTLCGPCAFWSQRHVPCPTCGMTTAVSLLMHGRLLCSLACQPFGCGVGIASIVLAALGYFGVVAGRWPCPAISTPALEKGLVLIAVFFVTSWVYKMLVMRMLC